MSNLSLEITLEDGKKAIFPMSFRATEYYEGSELHESQIPCMSRYQEIRLDEFTGYEYSWALVEYHYAEGLTTQGELDHEENDEYGVSFMYSWQMLLDGKPATYAEVDQSLNCDYWLEISSSRQESSGFIPLHKEGGELDISDAIYQAAEVDHENGTEEDGTHYGQVLEAIEPILKRQVEFVKTTIDGIAYEFSLSRCAE